MPPVSNGWCNPIEFTRVRPEGLPYTSHRRRAKRLRRELHVPHPSSLPCGSRHIRGASNTYSSLRDQAEGSCTDLHDHVTPPDTGTRIQGRSLFAEDSEDGGPRGGFRGYGTNPTGELINKRHDRATLGFSMVYPCREGRESRVLSAAARPLRADLWTAFARHFRPLVDVSGFCRQ
jgi:hypothetical protein